MCFLYLSFLLLRVQLFCFLSLYFWIINIQDLNIWSRSCYKSIQIFSLKSATVLFCPLALEPWRVHSQQPKQPCPEASLTLRHRNLWISTICIPLWWSALGSYSWDTLVAGECWKKDDISSSKYGNHFCSITLGSTSWARWRPEEWIHSWGPFLCLLSFSYHFVNWIWALSTINLFFLFW